MAAPAASTSGRNATEADETRPSRLAAPRGVFGRILLVAAGVARLTRLAGPERGLRRFPQQGQPPAGRTRLAPRPSEVRVPKPKGQARGQAPSCAADPGAAPPAPARRACAATPNTRAGEAHDCMPDYTPAAAHRFVDPDGTTVGRSRTAGSAVSSHEADHPPFDPPTEGRHGRPSQRIRLPAERTRWVSSGEQGWVNSG